MLVGDALPDHHRRGVWIAHRAGVSVLIDAPVPALTVPAPRAARRLAVLGDSTAVGLGDPLPDGSWRGVGPLLADALGIDPRSGDYLNASFTGARMKCVRTDQLPAALAHRPDVAVLVVGMNDTLRSNFDAAQIAADLETAAAALQEAGACVLAIRFHDHSRVFRLPKPLAHALRARIDELNGAIDRAVARRGIGCYDVGAEPATYKKVSWSVDRLHPSERGHRLLARGFAGLARDAGFAVPRPVSLECGGGAEATAWAHVGWLVVKGIPWLGRRGRDLIPYAAAITVRHLANSATRRVAIARQ